MFLKSQEIKERAEEIIRNSFSEKISIMILKYEIQNNNKRRIENFVKQRFFSDHVFLYKIYSGNDLIAVGMLDNVYGKSQPITFIVIFDLNGFIITSDIVKYREPYGGGISNRSWNNQFKGKNSKSSFKFGEDINSISGATISVNSVTLGIQKLAVLFDEIKKDL
jgi:Na+-translocating ferredoxin:NAD+ oxidoreductase RnfG subunit